MGWVVGLQRNSARQAGVVDSSGVEVKASPKVKKNTAKKNSKNTSVRTTAVRSNGAGSAGVVKKNHKRKRSSNISGIGESSDSVLKSEAVDKLLILCEEVTRATPSGVRRFIEPAPGVLARAKSQQHNIIFGRRGSGKSSLLRKAVADLTVDRRPISFVDMETFKGHTYPDVLISVLIKSLQEFK